MLARHTKRMLIVVCAAAVIGPASAAMACHEDLARLKHEYSSREAQLKYAYKAERRALDRNHRALLDNLHYARKQAHRLCGPERTAAIDQMNYRRRMANKTHSCQIRELNANRRAALDALDAEYHLARKSLKCACNRPPQIVVKPLPVTRVHPPVHDPLPVPPTVGQPYGAAESPFVARPRYADSGYRRTLRFSGSPTAPDHCDLGGCRPETTSDTWSNLLLSLAAGYLGR